MIVELTAVVDLFLYDVKHVSGGAHRELTGVDTGRILANFSALLEQAGAERIVRGSR